MAMSRRGGVDGGWGWRVRDLNSHSSQSSQGRAVVALGASSSGAGSVMSQRGIKPSALPKSSWVRPLSSTVDFICSAPVCNAGAEPK